MTRNEKQEYFISFRNLRKKQIEEKNKRLLDYINNNKNENVLFKIVNNNKNNIKFDFDFSQNQIYMIKICIKNKIKFPPEKFFLNTFLEKVWKDEETGEINFWTKRLYNKIILLEIKYNNNNNNNNKNNENNNNNENNENNNNNENNENINYKLSDINKICENIENLPIYNENDNKPWLNVNNLQKIFNNINVAFDANNFISNLTLENFNFSSNNIIKIIPINNNENNNNNLYVSFSAKINNDINNNSIFPYIKIQIYEIEINKKMKKIKIIFLKNFYDAIKLNLENKEYFFVIVGGLFPYGFLLNLFSNDFNINNYNYYELLSDYKGFNYKHFNIKHENLKENNFYILKRFKIFNNNNNINYKNFFFDYKINKDENIKDYFDIYVINNVNKNKNKILPKNIVKIFFPNIININNENNNNDNNKYIFIEIVTKPIKKMPKSEIDFYILFEGTEEEIDIKEIEIKEQFTIFEKGEINNKGKLFDSWLFTNLNSDNLISIYIELENHPQISKEELNEIQNDNNNNNNNDNDNDIPPLSSMPDYLSFTVYYYIEEKLIFSQEFLELIYIPLISLKSKDFSQFKTFDNLPFNNLIISVNNNEPYRDIYYKINFYCHDKIMILKNSKEEDIIEEINLKISDKNSRIKFLIKDKIKRGEILTKEEEEIAYGKRVEKIESNSEMFLSHIPEKNINEENNNNNKRKSFSLNLNKILPKINSYKSIMFRNFYNYSNINNNHIIIKKQKNLSMSLPDINKYKNVNNEENIEIKKEKINEEINDFYNKRNNENIDDYNKIKNSFLNDIFIHRNKIKTSYEKNKKILNSIIKENNNNIIIKNNFNSIFNEIKNNENEIISNFNYFYNEIKKYLNYEKILKNDLKEAIEILSKIKENIIINEIKKFENNKNQKNSNKKELEKYKNEIKDSFLIINEEIVNKLNNLLN